MKKVLSVYSDLGFEIYILFASRIINRMGDFVHIFLTLFLTTRMGMDEKGTGFFIMLAGLSRVAGILAGGKTADKIGRKAVIVAGQGAAAFFLIPCGFLGNSLAVPWLIIISGFFNGAVRPASGSMVADLSKGEKRKAAYSLMYLGTNFGVAIGPVIAGFLFKNHTSWIFWGDGATTLLSALMIFTLIRESRPDKNEEEESLRNGPEMERMEHGNTFRAIISRPYLLAFSFLAFLSSSIYAQHSFMIPLHLETIFTGNSARYFGYIMSFNAVTVLVMTSPVLLATSRYSAAFNTGIAVFCYSAGFGMLYFINSIQMFFFSAFIWTTGEILMVTNFSIYLANHSPINHRGRFNSFMNTVTGLGFVAGPFITGIISSGIGIISTWPYISVAGLITGVVLLMMDRSERNIKCSAERKTAP